MPDSSWIIFVFILHLKSTDCLRDMVLQLPPAVSLGESAVLSCEFHLQGEQLYTLKLYKGRHEFLQLVPNKEPPLKLFPLKGVNVQDIKLNGTDSAVHGLSLRLADVTLFTTGLYGCEASADESFHTELVRKQFTVLVKPKERPMIKGFKSRYRVGDILNMTCEVSDTFPEVNVTWFISGKRIFSQNYVKTVQTSSTTGLLTTKSHLSLQVKQEHFHSGHLTAKCVASILTMHWQSKDIKVSEERPATLAKSAKTAISGEPEDTFNQHEDKGFVNNQTRTKTSGVKRNFFSCGIRSDPLSLIWMLITLVFIRNISHSS